MPNDAMASVGRNLASFGIGQLRDKFLLFSLKSLKVWLVPRFCQPTALMVADPRLLQNQ